MAQIIKYNKMALAKNKMGYNNSYNWMNHNFATINNIRFYLGSLNQNTQNNNLKNIKTNHNGKK
jgi:hypothetical protein